MEKYYLIAVINNTDKTPIKTFNYRPSENEIEEAINDHKKTVEKWKDVIYKKGDTVEFSFELASSNVICENWKFTV